MIESPQNGGASVVDTHRCLSLGVPKAYSLSVERSDGIWILEYRALPSRLGDDDISAEIALSCPILFCPFCGMDLLESACAELHKTDRIQFAQVARVIASPAYGRWWLQIHHLEWDQENPEHVAIQLDPLDQLDDGVALRIHFCPVTGLELDGGASALIARRKPKCILMMDLHSKCEAEECLPKEISP